MQPKRPISRPRSLARSTSHTHLSSAASNATSTAASSISELDAFLRDQLAHGFHIGGSFLRLATVPAAAPTFASTSSASLRSAADAASSVVRSPATAQSLAALRIELDSLDVPNSSSDASDRRLRTNSAATSDGRQSQSQLSASAAAAAAARSAADEAAALADEAAHPLDLSALARRDEAAVRQLLDRLSGVQSTYDVAGEAVAAAYGQRR